MAPQNASRPRKTPSQARSKATSEALLTAAAHILETQGLAGFNTNAVAERAGVSIGSLYQYFPNKDAILGALIEQHNREFSEMMATVFATADGPSLIDDLGLLLQEAVDWHSTRYRLSRILDAEERRLSPHLELEACSGNAHTALSTLLERRRDEVGGGDLGRVAFDIGLISRTLMESEGDRPDPHWPSAIERTLSAVSGYISAHRRLSRMADAA